MILIILAFILVCISMYFIFVKNLNFIAGCCIGILVLTFVLFIMGVGSSLIPDANTLNVKEISYNKKIEIRQIDKKYYSSKDDYTYTFLIRNGDTYEKKDIFYRNIKIIYSDSNIAELKVVKNDKKYCVLKWIFDFGPETRYVAILPLENNN